MEEEKLANSKRLSENSPVLTQNLRANITLLANDINNQLSGIIGSAELLKKDNLDPFEKSQLICDIVACARKTTSLAKRMLHFETNTTDSGLQKGESAKSEKFPVSSERKTVLVIDDEEVIRSVSKSILERAGYKVLSAASGKEGIDKFREHNREVLCVLLDLTMPFMPGNLVFAKLKALDPQAQVFLMSGMHIKQVMSDFETQDVAGFIQKPFLMEELLDKISGLVQVALH